MCLSQKWSRETKQSPWPAESGWEKGNIVSNPIQKTLDTAQTCMQEALMRTYSGPAGTRVLHSFVSVLCRELLTEEQHQQVEALLDLHEYCLRHNGEVKG